MTIDQLARRAGCTTRNIRNYQTSRLLPSPTIVRRVAYYDEGHLGRLRLIAGLQEQGFSLAGIGRLLCAWEDGRGLSDLLGFERALTEPWVEEEPEMVTPEHLLTMFPEATTDPEVARRSVELGLIVPEGDMVRIPSPGLIRIGAELAAAGVPLRAVHGELADLSSDMDRVAKRFVALFEDHVWKPFVTAGMPADRLSDVTEALLRLRPLATAAVTAVLKRAMAAAVAQSTAANAPGNTGKTIALELDEVRSL